MSFYEKIKFWKDLFVKDSIKTVAAMNDNIKVTILSHFNQITSNSFHF
jgi:hypothetical protein